MQTVCVEPKNMQFAQTCCEVCAYSDAMELCALCLTASRLHKAFRCNQHQQSLMTSLL